MPPSPCCACGPQICAEDYLLEPFEDFDKLVFVFAKTMPENPHEYVVRTADNEAAYVRLFELIAAQGVRCSTGVKIDLAAVGIGAMKRATIRRSSGVP